MQGPFYVKKDGEFVLSPICEDCAFYCNPDDDCGLLECIVMECIEPEVDDE